MQNDTRIAVDVAKAVFEIALSDRPGRVARRERLPRAQFLTYFAQQPAGAAHVGASAARARERNRLVAKQSAVELRGFGGQASA